MSPEAAIADHGVIGDLQTAALVSSDGTVDWFCCPRFDSPSVFGALLDNARGGHFAVRPANPGYRAKQMYYPDSAVLITRFSTETGVGEVIDFMPPLGPEPTPSHRLVRVLRCVRGRVDFDVQVAPRFDYGRTPHRTTEYAHGVVFSTDNLVLALHVVRDAGEEHLAHARVTDGDLRLTLSLHEDQVRGLVLESSAPGPPREIPVAEIQQLFDNTVGYWRRWLAGSTYDGRWREAVERSAITLKLLTYAPTGGMVAALTAGLPEELGGERNWDYRYTWVRDTSFAVSALLRLGFTEEAAQFGNWLAERIRERAGGVRGPLEIMYRVDGSTDLYEEVLEHWSGHRGSRPVRIGNAAAGQLQLDIYGEALDCVHTAHQAGLGIAHQGWTAILDVLDWLAEHWDQPEEGIWEARGGRRSHTYGRLMTWVAFDRAIRLATGLGRPAPLERWRRERDEVHKQIMARAWHPTRLAFVQHQQTDVLDAALLWMPRTGFIAPKDPLWLSTLDAMRTELVVDGLVYRYDPAASPDGLRGGEGTFSLCSFAYVHALTLAGRLDEARYTFEKMLTHANHLGLYAEEIALNGEQLGNFPQSFTHLALLDTALTLDEALR